MGQKLTKQDVRDAVQHAFEQTKAVTGGKNADYIPYLANVPSDLFGIAVCLPDGEIIAAGDTEYKFGIESVSKVPTAILTMNQYSPEEVLTKIGADATGLPFNSIMAILLEKDHPSTPLVNAGAIAACSMIKPIGKPDAKWEAIQGFIEGLCGSSVEVIDELYKSETATNFNNKSIAWLLKNYSRIYDDPDMALDLYTRQCSIGVTARQLAVAAATIAFDGVNPVTKQTVFKPDLGTRIASMMATVGFYEHTGDWLFNTGLPAKTGVGGGIIANGQLVRGVHFTAGEYSFVNTNADEWENTEKTMACQCSTSNLLKWYRARKALPEDAPLDGRSFFAAANAGEPEALEVLRRFCHAVAVQIYNLTVLLDVEKVAIGGGISKQPLLLDDLRRVYAGLFASRGESPYMIGLPRCEIVPCHFSSEANQVGALYTYLQAESKTI